MAVTTIPQGLVEKAWAKDTWTTALNNIFFGKFMGPSVDNIIQVKEELKKEAGDSITMRLLMKLKGDGVTGDNTLEGNEEAMQYRDFTVTVDQIRNAVGSKARWKNRRLRRICAKTLKQPWPIG